MSHLVHGDAMQGDDETTTDDYVADRRNFYKVEVWTWDDRIELACDRERSFTFPS